MKTLLLILLFLASTSASAALSKWVDDSGKVHYSDQAPPANVKAKTLRSSPTNSNPLPEKSEVDAIPVAPKSIAEREADLKKAQKEKKDASQKADQEQSNAEAMKASCSTAQQNLRVLQEGIRVVEVDSTGERSDMDDEKRQQNIAKAQQIISHDCK